MLKQFQLEDQMDRFETEITAGGFNDGRSPDVWLNELMRGDDAFPRDPGGVHDVIFH